VESGSFASADNVILGEIRGNELRGNLEKGVLLSSGFDGAQDNTILGEVRGNTVQDSVDSGVGLIAGWLASRNRIAASITDNVVTNSGNNGIVVIGGTAESRESATGETSNNEITGEILRNTVQNSTENGIAVFGGFDSSSGAVVGNTARQEISNNTADGIRCENGIAGNSAICTGTDVPPALTTPTGFHPERPQADDKQMFVRGARARTSDDALGRLEAKIAQLHERAQEVTDDRVRTRLFAFAKRLAAAKAKQETREAARE
jgi:hypothetical protein